MKTARQILLRATFLLAVLFPVRGEAAALVELRAVGSADIRMQPGQSGLMVIRIENRGPDAISSVTIHGRPTNTDGSRYSLAMRVVPGCSILQTGGSPFGSATKHFQVGPLAAGQNIACTIDVQRPLTADDDTHFNWSVFGSPSMPVLSSGSLVFSLGSLTNLAIATNQLGFVIEGDGRAHARLRLRVHNHGPSDVGYAVIGYCSEFPLPEFVVDGSMVGGCGSFTGSFGCFDTETYGFRIGALAVGAEASCLFDVRTVQAYVRPGVLDFRTLFVSNAATGGLLADTDYRDDRLSILLGLPEGIPSLEWLALAILLCALVLSGCESLKKKHSSQPRFITTDSSALANRSRLGGAPTKECNGR